MQWMKSHDQSPKNEVKQITVKTQLRFLWGPADLNIKLRKVSKEIFNTEILHLGPLIT